MGPWGATDAAKSAILTKVYPKFVPEDVLTEVLGRFVAALLKTEADVQLVPLAGTVDPGDSPTSRDAAQAEADRIAAATRPILAALAAWWDRVKLWEATKAALTRSRWAGRGVLRLWVPPGKLVETTTTDAAGNTVAVQALPSGLDLAGALACLELAAPDVDNAAVVTDPDTTAQAAVFLYTVEDQQFAEVWFADGDVTVLRVLAQDTREQQEFRFPVGGRLPLAEMQADLLITEPVRRQQDQLNFFKSLAGRTGETAGFPERYIMGASPEGSWTSVNPGEGNYIEIRDQGDTRFYLVPSTRTLGAGTTVELRGIPITNPDGSTSVTTPTVERFEPVDPDFVLKLKGDAYEALLRQCKQGHVVGPSAANQSGEGQQQRRADFEDDANAVRPAVEGMLRNILEAALAWAAAMGADDVLATYRVQVTLHVDSGPISPDEVRVLREQVEAGLLSEETALARAGVEDVPAELARIRRSPEGRARLSKVQAEAVQAWTLAGCALEKAGELVGMTPDEVALLVAAQTPPGQQVPGITGVVQQ